MAANAAAADSRGSSAIEPGAMRSTASCAAGIKSTASCATGIKNGSFGIGCFGNNGIKWIAQWRYGSSLQAGTFGNYCSGRRRNAQVSVGANNKKITAREDALAHQEERSI